MSRYSDLSKVLLAGMLCILLLYVVGYFWPERFWGVHFFRFLKGEEFLGLVLTSAAIALMPFDLVQRLTAPLNNTAFRTRPVLGLGVSVIYSLIVYAFPIAYDPYGDAVRFTDKLDQVMPANSMVYHYLFGFSLDAWSGEKSVLALVTVISHHLNVTLGESFRLLGAVSAGVFSFAWISLLQLKIRENALVIPIYLIGLFGPYTLIFHGHSEIYAPGIAMVMCWVLAVSMALERKTLGFSLLVLLVNLFMLKLHPIGVMMLPSSVLMLLSHGFKFKHQILQDGRVIPLVLVPAIGAGLVVYFYVLGDHVDNRTLQITAKQYDHLFLPLFSPDPPLHKYNLFSLNHIVDFGNVLLMSSPVLLVLFAIGLANRSWIKEELPTTLVHFILTLILFLLLLFAINPLLSMPMDWDLFMLFVPVLFGCSVVVLDSEFSKTLKRFTPLLVGLSFLSMSFVVSSQNVNNISDRLNSIAVHVHNTYYEWTMNISDRSFSISTEPLTTQKLKRDALREKLRANALETDREFSEFLRQDAKRSYKLEKDYPTAREFLNQALAFNPADGNNHMTAVELNFELKNMEQALQHGRELVKLEFPDRETSLRIAIHCALEAESYDEAQQLCFSYLNEFESDFILSIYTRLVSKDNVDSIKFLFRRGD